MIQKNVERIRKAKGVTKTHMAKQLGISLQGYRHITTGNTRLDVDRLQTISKVLGVEPAVFDDELTESVINELKQVI